MILAPGVLGHLAPRIVAGHRPLGEIELAEHHCPRRPEPADHRGVEIGDMVFEHRGAAHSAYASGIAEVLHRHRHPVQRPAISSRHDVGLGFASLGDRLVRHDRRVGFQGPVQRFDPLQLGHGDLDRGEFPALDQFRKLDDRQIVKRFAHRMVPDLGRWGA
jgi:hypothetical protein